MVTICTTRFNINQFCVLPTQCICVFYVDLRTNSDYFCTTLTDAFYNREGVCLLRGTSCFTAGALNTEMNLRFVQSLRNYFIV